MTYKIELSILSNAPQLINTEFKVGKTLLRARKGQISSKNIKKCIKKIFPLGSIVRIKEVDVANEHFRQLITIVAKSLREPSNDLIIDGMPQDFYSYKVIKINE